MLAVPGEITSALSAGTNGLLRSGGDACDLGGGRARGARARGGSPPAAVFRTIRLRSRCSPRSQRARRTQDELSRATGLGGRRARGGARDARAGGRDRGATRGGGREYDRPMTPYWLDEPAPAFAASQLDRDRRRRDRRRRRHRLRLRARARRGGPARPDAWTRGASPSGASGRNGGFALRGGAPRRTTRSSAIGRRASARWRSGSGRRPRSSGWRARRRRVSAARQPAPRRRRRGAGRAPRRVRGAPRGRFEAEWVDEPDGPLAGRFPAAILHPTDAALQPARLVRRLAAACRRGGGRDRRAATASTSLDELDAETVVVATDGYPSGLLGELEGLIVPTRGQVIATEPLAERLFELPHYGRHGFDYWQQTPDGRIVAGGFRDARSTASSPPTERRPTPIQEALESFVDGLVGRELRVDYRWAGIFGLVLDFLPVVGRVPGSDGTGSPAATRGTATCSASPAARLVGAGDARRQRPAARPVRAGAACSG